MKKEHALHTVLIIISALTLVLVAFQLFALRSYVEQAVEGSEAMKVGGKENYDKLQQLYKSDGFKNAQAQQIDSALSQMNGQQGATNTQANAQQAQDQFPSGKLTKDQLEKIKAGTYLDGKSDAKVTIIEYSDPECPFCIRHYNDKTIATVMGQYNGQVNHILKVVQGVNHPGTQYKSLSILCAAAQGGAKAYYGMFDAILGNSTPEAPATTGQIAGFAKTLGLNATKLATCVDNKDPAALYAANRQEALSFNSSGTPGNLIINNESGEWKLIAGAYPADTFTQVIGAWVK